MLALSAFQGSGIGRFTQADTYHGDGLNLYVYAGNNPVRYVDPSGHCCKNGSCTNIDNNAVITNKFPNEAIPENGTKLDYYIENGEIKGINKLDFVITSDNKLIIGKKHHYLGNTQEVLAAGQLKINGKGHIKRIDNLSGHYRPTVSEAMGYQSLFDNLGLNLNNTWIEYYRFDIDEDGIVVKIHLDYVKMLGGKK